MRLQSRFLLSALCLVVLCTPAHGQPQTPTVSLRSRVVTPDPGIPKVRVTVDRPRVRLGTQVIFSVIPANIVNDRRYVVTLYFGDGQTRVMSEPQTPHLYQAVGNYTYSVDVKHSQPTNQTRDKPPNAVPRVTLTASPVSVLEREPITFAAQLSGTYPNVQYRFAFGDGRFSAWQSSPQTQHAYARAGNYSAYVDIGDGQNRLGGSTRKRVDVTAPVSLSVSLTASPGRTQSGTPVAFNASVSSPRGTERYRFNFGDGSQTIWQADRRALHTYKNGGSYRAYVDVTQSVNNQSLSASSSPTLVTVQSAAGQTPQPTARRTPDSRPTPTPGSSPNRGSSLTPPPNASPSGPALVTASPVKNTTPSATTSSPTKPTLGPLSSNTWPYLLLAALLLFLVYQASSYLFVAKPTFAPFADPGVAALADEKGRLPLDFQLVLNPNVSAGDYSVSTAEPQLVKNAGGFQDRQIIEI